MEIFAEARDSTHRVVLVSGGIQLGGAATFLVNFGGELVRRGVPTLVVSLESDNPYATDFELLEVPLHVEDEHTTIFEDRVRSALCAIRSFQPTVVISCLGASSYEVLRYVPESVIRIAMLQSDFPASYPSIAGYAATLDAVVGVSQTIQSKLRSEPGLNQLPSYYVPYGVTIPNSVSPRSLRARDHIRIIYPGRLSRQQKRVHLFSDIRRQLTISGTPFKWTIAGEGPELPWLKTQMPSAPPDATVHFVGTTSYRDMPGLLDAHDVLLLTSDHEGLPLSLLEAMARGLVPVVSNLRSGISEIVDEDCGVLVDPNDTTGYAAGITRLWRDPATFTQMSIAARGRVQEFSVAAVTERWLGLFAELGRAKTPEMRRRQWDSNFRIQGVVNHRSIRYTAPMRVVRRALRMFRK